MRTIGIRAAPRELTFAIYDTQANEVLNVEVIKLPAAFGMPDSLKYARSNLLDIIREYDVQRAGIRITESNVQSINIERVQIEGVIQEAFASSNLKGYYVWQISSISARLGVNRTDFKPIINGENRLGIANWEKMNDKEREAVLTAIGAQRV
jgi:hypothetical protein